MLKSLNMTTHMHSDQIYLNWNSSLDMHSKRRRQTELSTKALKNIYMVAQDLQGASITCLISNEVYGCGLTVLETLSF